MTHPADKPLPEGALNALRRFKDALDFFVAGSMSVVMGAHEAAKADARLVPLHAGLALLECGCAVLKGIQIEGESQRTTAERAFASVVETVHGPVTATTTPSGRPS